MVDGANRMPIEFKDLTIRAKPEDMFVLPQGEVGSKFLMDLQEAIQKALMEALAPKTVTDMHTLATLLAVTSIGIMGDSSKLPFTERSVNTITEVFIERVMATAKCMKMDVEVPN